jgi:hypothetical protein
VNGRQATDRGTILKTPNAQLADWLGRTGWSLGELARRVRAKAIEGRHPHISSDPSSVIGDAAESERYARLSIDHARAQKRARRGAMSQAALAVSHLQRRDLEAAHAAGLRTLTLTGQVKSSRAVEAVQNLQRQMVPFGRHALVADFNDRAHELLAA